MAKSKLVAIRLIKHFDAEFFLRLYAFTLAQITDSTFMGHVVQSLKRILRKTTHPKSIVRHPVELGVAYHLSSLAFDHFFSIYSHPILVEKHSIYDTVPLMENILEAWFCNGMNWRIDEKLGMEAGSFMWDYDHEKDAGKLARMLHGPGREILVRIVRECTRDPLYASMRHAYALEVADRLLHDRQISAYIASVLVRIAPLKMDRNRREYMPGQFVRRTRWPAFVKPLILARDRGKCAYCKTDMATELLANTHIDHMYSLKKGGCNDVLNLQLLCEKCNREKGTSSWDIETSVPSYHKRYAKTTFMAQRRKDRRLMKLAKIDVGEF